MSGARYSHHLHAEEAAGSLEALIRDYESRGRRLRACQQALLQAMDQHPDLAVFFEEALVASGEEVLTEAEQLHERLQQEQQQANASTLGRSTAPQMQSSPLQSTLREDMRAWGLTAPTTPVHRLASQRLPSPSPAQSVSPSTPLWRQLRHSIHNAAVIIVQRHWYAPDSI